MSGLQSLLLHSQQLTNVLLRRNCFHGNITVFIVITTLSTVKKGRGRGLMDKNELKNDIKNALGDLKDDYTAYATRYDDLNDKIDTPESIMMTELWHYSAHSEHENSLEKHFSREELEKMGIHSRKASNEYADGYALFKVIFPQIAGFVIGCAVARLFNTGFIGYIIFGVIFAFLVGVHKSTYNDKISLKYAIIKNIVLMLVEIALILLFAGIYGIIYITG